jgi:phage tail sheath protein FI
MAFQISPGVNVSEVDLTTVVPAVSTTAGAFVGPFQWGPVNKRTLVTSESALVNTFGKPDGNTATSFFSAANFLAYGNNLQVVRVANTGSNNAIIAANVSLQTANLDSLFYPNANNANAVANLLSNLYSYITTLNNEDVYDINYQTDSYLATFAARYPGVLGNSLKVVVWDANVSTSQIYTSNTQLPSDTITGGNTQALLANTNTAPQIFSSWAYKNYFSGAPSTSSYTSARNGANDQFHMVVLDEGGIFTGTKGAILETFPFLSKAVDCINDDGSSAYYRTVIRDQSRYIYALGPMETRPQANIANGVTAFSSSITNWGNSAAGTSFIGAAMGAANTGAAFSFAGGRSLAVNNGTKQSGYDLFDNPDEVDISLIVTADANTSVQQTAIDLAGSRKDCIAFVSPEYVNVVNTATPATSIATWASTLSRASTYAVADSGWKYQFDKYNNVYRWIPLNGDIAGLCARTDQTNDPWFSPAGVNRGAIKNVVKLAWNPTQADRDNIYSIGVNPVVSLPGQGTILYGDKTLTTQPSAFSRINVRRLFIVLEKAISTAAKFSLFELNDEFTRAQFVAIVEPYLRDVKGRRGIYDYRVVCDTTNNTPQVIDSNQFVGDIYIKPARSINYIQLNFIAVRSGVSFSEIVGSV